MWHRKPVVAGTFYPADGDELRAQIALCLGEAGRADLPGEVVALIAPHAGYVYSGPIAGHAYRAVEDLNPQVVIVLAPSHRARYDGASVIPEGVYETPLGEVPIDGTIGNRLVQRPAFGFIKEAHTEEHSLEVQVPFLQHVAENFSLVPIVIGTTELETCRILARGIIDAIKEDDRKILLVISTDLSHYHPYDLANALDETCIEGLKSLDEKTVKEVLSGKAEACGEGPLLTGLMVARALQGERLEVLHYGNSGDTAGDKNQVVGYLAAAIVK